MPDKLLALTPAEKAKVAITPLPAFLDRSKIAAVKDPETGVRFLQVGQELPAYLRRDRLRKIPAPGFAMSGATAKEVRAARRAGVPVARQRVRAGETIEIEGGMGERLFFKVLRDGLVQIHRARQIVPASRGGSEERDIMVIDEGPGMAVLKADLDLYEGFREVLRGD